MRNRGALRRRNQLTKRNLHGRMQRSPRHVVVVEKTIGAARKGLLRSVGRTQTAEAVCGVAAHHRLHELGRATTQTEVRKGGGLKERLKVGHTPSLSSFPACLHLRRTSRRWPRLCPLKSNPPIRPAGRISAADPDL